MWGGSSDVSGEETHHAPTLHLLHRWTGRRCCCRLRCRSPFPPIHLFLLVFRWLAFPGGCLGVQSLVGEGKERKKKREEGGRGKSFGWGKKQWRRRRGSTRQCSCRTFFSLRGCGSGFGSCTQKMCVSRPGMASFAPGIPALFWNRAERKGCFFSFGGCLPPLPLEQEFRAVSWL